MSAQLGNDRGGDAIGGVVGWEYKARAVVELLPQVTEVLVATEDRKTAADEFEKLEADRRIEVVGVKTLTDALSHTFGREAQRKTIAGLEPARRSELVSRLFSDTLKGTSTFVSWGPTTEVIDAALNWPDLCPVDHQRLLFVRAVAARYAQESERPELPDEAWLEGLDGAIRMQVVAHILQHHVRWGETPAGWALQSVGVAQAMGDWPACLRARGAHARWLDACGEHENALREHQLLVASWLRNLEAAESSYSLTEWLRLAGALDDEQSFEEACEVTRDLESRASLDPTSTMYVRLGRAMGAWALGLKRGSDWTERARSDIEAVRAGAIDRPNWVRVERVALRYLIYIDPTDRQSRERFFEVTNSGTDRFLVDLIDEAVNLRTWIGALPTHHQWRARILLDQKEDVEHILRFFVDA